MKTTFNGLASGIVVACLCSVSVADPVATVDFSADVAKIRPALHSSGLTPRSGRRYVADDTEAVRSMNFTYARTHDWALVDPGQRVVDYQYVFPLFDRDAKDPKNYFFAPTDHLLQLSRDAGLEIYYRLGTSIEHTGDVHFNALVPSDFEKTAEIFAGIVRHYNKGWANGKEWNIRYWEIWNEPDGIDNMWCLPGPEGKDPVKMRELFVRFFVTVLKRLKSEFPDVKVGGPALCWFNPVYVEALLKGCKEAGVAPDFLSWHYYGPDPDMVIRRADIARRMCDQYGFTDCELINNEWHYILTWDGIHGKNSSTAMVKRALDGPTGHNMIDSACFTLSVLAQLQTSRYDQAYYYGCAHEGNWGYTDEYGGFNKNYYALKLFGEIVRDYDAICASKPSQKTVTTLALRSKDGKRNALLAVDYRGTEQTLEIPVAGADGTKRVKAVLLDQSRNLVPCAVDWDGATLTLVKPEATSAAFFVTFDR